MDKPTLWTYRKANCPFTGAVEQDRWTIHRDRQMVGKMRYVVHGQRRWWFTAFLLPEEVFGTVETMPEALDRVRQLVIAGEVNPNAR